MDQAPAPVGPRLVQQPFDRPPAGPGQAVLQLAHLLGRVDMHRRIGGQPGHDRQFLRRHRAQGMRRDPDHGVRQAGASPARGLVQPREAVGIVDEPALALGRWCAAEAAMGIEHRQQGQADAGGRRRRGDAASQFGGVSIGPPVQVVVQIVELAHAGEPAF